MDAALTLGPTVSMLLFCLSRLFCAVGFVQGALRICIMSLARSELSIKMQQSSPVSSGRSNMKQLISIDFQLSQVWMQEEDVAGVRLGSQMPSGQGPRIDVRLGCNMY